MVRILENVCLEVCAVSVICESELLEGAVTCDYKFLLNIIFKQCKSKAGVCSVGGVNRNIHRLRIGICVENLNTCICNVEHLTCIREDKLCAAVFKTCKEVFHISLVTGAGVGLIPCCAVSVLGSEVHYHVADLDLICDSLDISKRGETADMVLMEVGNKPSCNNGLFTVGESKELTHDLIGIVIVC